jgi:hypothetical protein
VGGFDTIDPIAYQIQVQKNFAFHCGGTIISEQYVLSAAHCFWDKRNNRWDKMEKFFLFAGKYKKNSIKSPVQVCCYFATRRYSTLLYATLRYSTLLYATLRYSTLLYATLLYATLLYATLCFLTQLVATRRYSTLPEARRC